MTDATPFPISLLWNTEAEDTEGYVAQSTAAEAFGLQIQG